MASVIILIDGGGRVKRDGSRRRLYLLLDEQTWKVCNYDRWYDEWYDANANCSWRMTQHMPAAVSKELDAFLREPRHAIAATNRRDGTSQLTPVWFDWDGSVVRFSTPGGTAKNTNIRRDNRIAICIDDPGPDRRFVTLYGSAELDEDPQSIADHIRRIRTKYGYKGETTVDSVRQEGRLLVTFRPERIVASPSLR